MAVHARGYRTYDGGFDGRPAAFVIAGEAWRTVWRGRALKRIGVIWLIWFSIWSFLLYMGAGSELGDRMFRILRGAGDDFSLRMLEWVLRRFYAGVAVLTALLAAFVGAGLVSDDLRARALPLYLVRPIRALDYVFGKALVIPSILAVMALVPGLLFYLLVALWQPPGESMPFLMDNLHLLGFVFEHFLLASAAYTGLVLFLSSRTPRRGAVVAISAAVIFVGVLLRRLAIELHIEGTLGEALRLADLPRLTIAVFWRELRELPMAARGGPTFPGERLDTIGVAIALLLLGLYVAWRRALSVEVTE